METWHPEPPSEPFNPRRIGLVGCVKTKSTFARPAQDLYLSPLFVGRRRFVERTCDQWWILSALHGLVDVNDVLEPYDFTLIGASRAEKRAWSETVLASIDDRVHASKGDAFELHAGADYRLFGLEEGLLARGCQVENPTEGLRSGEQLAFYSRHHGPR
ncbi:MAG: hypothetical protein HKL85_01850 [Acidimicrobiaceae bacterium]|nr:hypothetical protein [Acidimicrobiaceae bacterium]